MSGAPVDLSALRRQPEPVQPEATQPPRRPLLLRLVPLLLVLGFGAVFGAALMDFFESAVPVTVVRPVPAEGGAAGGAGRLLFQAAGWVEPDPFPIEVPALTAGVVADLLVQEGDRVEKGSLLARLVREDAELEHRRAQQQLQTAEAELERAQRVLTTTQSSFDAALTVTRDVASSEARLAEAEAAARLADAALEAAKAELGVAEFDLKTQAYLREQESNAPWQLGLAEAQRDVAKARLAQREAELARSRAQQRLAEAELARAKGESDLRTVDRLALDRALQDVAVAQAQVGVARTELAIAALRLERTDVRSGADGIVLQRLAEPGSRVGPAAGAGALVTLYDPTRLRVRVDVPQGQVALASRGQRAEVRCDVRRGRPYAGEVIRIVERADIQKVTLEVQVRIADPDRLLKPDMLCQVAVYGRDEAEAEADTARTLYRLPARVLVGEASVFVVDPASGRAARRELEIVGRDGDDVLVRAGIDLSSKVVDQGRSGLEVGDLLQFGGKP